MNPNTIDLNIVVNGRGVLITANLNEPLHALIGKALEESGNSGQTPDNWEFRDANGQPLDVAKKIGDFGFASGTNLFLNLRAGVGGEGAIR